MMNNAIKDFVQSLYRNILLREGEAAGITGWTERAENGLTSVEMVKGFITSPEAQSIMSVLRLYQVFFDRAADLDGLRYWLGHLQDGRSLNDIAFSFSQSEEYKQKYSGVSADAIVESFYINLFGRASDAEGKSHWLNMAQHGGWNLGQVAAAFTASDEAMDPQGNAARFAESFLVLRSSNGSLPTTEAAKALAGHSLEQAITATQTVKGMVQAGTLEHVQVYRAGDESALKTAGLIPVQTDGSGKFLLSGGYGSLYAVGGKDVTTGIANGRWFSTVAASGSGEIVITPLTTVIHALVEQGIGITDAMALVNQAFGIDSAINLLTFHHLDKAIASDSSMNEKKHALAVKAVIAQLSILTEGAAALIKGTLGNTGIDTSMLSLRVADALAEKIAGAAASGKPFQAGALLGLNAYDVIKELVTNSLLKFEAAAAVPLKNAATVQSAGLTDDASKIIAAFNAPISKTVELIKGLSALSPGDLIDALSLIAKTEALALGEAHTLIGTGMQDGSLANELAMLLARNLGSAIQSFGIGRIADGVASTNAQSMIDRIFSPAPATPDQNWPDFFVTNTLGQLTFSGSATGNITIAIDMSGAISFSRGGVTAATKGSALSAVVVDLSAGQVLQLANSQLAQIADFTVKGGGSLVIQGAITLSALNGMHFDHHTGGVSYRIQDTPANILNAAPANLSGAQEVTVNAGTNVFYSVANATDLLSRLTSRTGLTLGVIDTASAILANHAITGVTAYKLSGNAGDLSVANAAALVAISGFDINGKTITVLDTAAAILANHAITGVSAYRLSADADNLSVANAAALKGIGGFHVNSKSITVQDTAAAILGNHAITDVSAYKLSEDADDLSAANATILAGISTFSTNSKDFIVLDTASAILASHSINGVTAYRLSENASDLTVANAAALVGINRFSTNGKNITVMDTAAAILAKHDITGVTAYKLSANAVDLTVANASTLASVSGFNVNGKSFTVLDTAAAIIAKHAISGVTAYKVLDTHTAIMSNHAAMSYASAFLLSADVVDMSVNSAAALAAVNGFGVNGHVFSVKDSFNAIRAKHAIDGVTKYKLDANTSVDNVNLLLTEGLALAKLHYTLADTATAINAATTEVLNASDGLFSTASSENDTFNLNRSGAVTVRMSIDLGAGDDNFVDGEGVDHINGNTGADTMDGGSGQDFYTYSDKGTDSSVNSGTATAAGFDIVDVRGKDGFYIAQFGPNQNRPELKGTLHTVLGAANPATGSGTDLLAALDTAYASVKVDNKDVMFVRFIDGNQYLVVNDGQDGNTGINAADTVIKIIGSSLPKVTGANLVEFGI
jgi:hypothetical protein